MKGQNDVATVVVVDNNKHCTKTTTRYCCCYSNISNNNNNNDINYNDNNSKNNCHAIIALCCCSFTNAYLVISVFPYSGYMILNLCPNLTTESVGIYAGLLSSSFFITRFITAYQWGKFADYYGRIYTLQIILILSGIFSILFGISTSIYTAIFFRACLGACNCIISTTKTIASELSNDDKLQRRTMGLVVGMRSWGLLIGPAVAGFLSEPIRQYHLDSLSIDNNNTNNFVSEWILKILQRFPFILPNLFGAICCLVAFVAIHFFVPETLECQSKEGNNYDLLPLTLSNNNNNHTNKNDTMNSSADVVVVTATTTTEDTPLLLQKVKVTTSKVVEQNNIDNTTTMVDIWNRIITRNHMIAHWMYSILSTYIDEAFPLFCMSTIGGLGMNELDIGQVLSGAGLIFAILQYVTFASITHHFGIYNSLFIGCILGSIPIAILPCSLLLRKNYTNNNRWLYIVFLSCIIGFIKLMHSLYYISMAVAINKTIHTKQRGRMNALVLTGNSIGKAIGPIFAGYIVTFSFNNNSSIILPEYGSILIWTIIVPIMGLIVTIQLYHLRKLVLSQ